jgi:hypothetical protein
MTTEDKVFAIAVRDSRWTPKEGARGNAGVAAADRRELLAIVRAQAATIKTLESRIVVLGAVAKARKP